jgi:hypothetical protein
MYCEVGAQAQGSNDKDHVALEAQGTICLRPVHATPESSKRTRELDQEYINTNDFVAGICQRLKAPVPTLDSLEICACAES